MTRIVFLCRRDRVLRREMRERNSARHGLARALVDSRDLREELGGESRAAESRSPRAIAGRDLLQVATPVFEDPPSSSRRGSPSPRGGGGGGGSERRHTPRATPPQRESPRTSVVARPVAREAATRVSAEVSAEAFAWFRDSQSQSVGATRPA